MCGTNQHPAARRHQGGVPISGTTALPLAREITDFFHVELGHCETIAASRLSGLGLCRIFLKVGYKVAVVELLRVQLSGFPGMDTGTGTLRNSVAQAQRGGYLRTFECGLLEMIGKGNRV